MTKQYTMKSLIPIIPIAALMCYAGYHVGYSAAESESESGRTGYVYEETFSQVRELTPWPNIMCEFEVNTPNGKRYFIAMWDGSEAYINEVVEYNWEDIDVDTMQIVYP